MKAKQPTFTNVIYVLKSGDLLSLWVLKALYVIYMSLSLDEKLISRSHDFKLILNGLKFGMSEGLPCCFSFY